MSQYGRKMAKMLHNAAKKFDRAGPCDTGTEKEEANCYLPKNCSTFQSRSSQISLEVTECNDMAEEAAHQLDVSRFTLFRIMKLDLKTIIFILSSH